MRPTSRIRLLSRFRSTTVWRCLGTIAPKRAESTADGRVNISKFEVLRREPLLLGIGLNEGSAIVVTGGGGKSLYEFENAEQHPKLEHKHRDYHYCVVEAGEEVVLRAVAYTGEEIERVVLARR